MYYKKKFINIMILVSLLFSNNNLDVSKITFYGNSFIDDRKLKSLIKLKSANFFSRSNFSQKKLNKDQIILESYYKSFGFLDINIMTEYYEDYTNHIFIKYFINEGRRYSLDKIEVSGNKLFNKDKILNFFYKTIENKYYNPNLLRLELESLRKNYLNNGKVDIEIMNEFIFDDTDVTLRINIFEGKTYIISNINIKGLKNINKKYVDREIIFNTGDIYNIDKIEESKKRIFDSGLFSSVSINHLIVSKKNGLIDVELDLREYKSSSIEANFGFKELEPFQDGVDVTGINVHVKWLTGNVLNTTSNIEIEGRLASEINFKILKETPFTERDISLSYRNPWTFSFRIPSILKIFHEVEKDEYNVVINGITYSLLLSKTINTRYEINSTLEIIQSRDSIFTSIEREPARNINFKYISNKIISPLNPKGGQYLSLSTSMYGTFLGGNRHFIKILNEYRKYYLIFRNNIIAIRIIGGYIANLDNNKLPAAYLFKTGGHSTLRGWSAPQYSEVPEGGLINNLFNIEYRIPFRNKWETYIFFDAVKIYNNYKSILNKKIMWNSGIGVVYNTKFGPCRFDLGFPYNNINNSQFHFSLLYMF